MKKPVKIALWSLVAAAVAIGSAAYALAPLQVETAVMHTADAKITFTEQGVYLYNRSVAVLPQISGEVLEIKVSDGDTVKKGDVLAVVSASDYEYQIKQLESNIDGFNAQINNLYAQERESKSALSQSRAVLAGQIKELTAAIKDYDKNQKSLDKQVKIQEDIITENGNLVHVLTEEYRQAREDYDDGFIELSQLNAVRTARIQAQASLDASAQQLEQMKNGGASKTGLEAQRDSLRSQIELIDKRLSESGAWAMQQYYNAMIDGTRGTIENMNEKLGQANVVASTDGIITDLPVKNSNIVSVAAHVAVISSEPVIEVFVPVREIDSVNIGDSVELILDKRLGDESSQGVVTLIEDEATMKISSLGVEERKIRVLVKPGENNLRIGYDMDVKFTALEEKNRIIAPKTSIFEKDGKDLVWIIENGAAKTREVVKAVETREGFVIASGLSAGDVVILDANIEGVKEGKKVTAG